MNYFRITIYNQEHNVTAILDSNGYYEKKWMLSSFFVKLGWTVVNIVSINEISLTNIPSIEPNKDCLVLRACKIGKAEINDKSINVLERAYTTI